MVSASCRLFYCCTRSICWLALGGIETVIFGGNLLLASISSVALSAISLGVMLFCLGRDLQRAVTLHREMKTISQEKEEVPEELQRRYQMARNAAVASGLAVTLLVAATALSVVALVTGVGFPVAVLAIAGAALLFVGARSYFVLHEGRIAPSTAKNGTIEANSDPKEAAKSLLIDLTKAREGATRKTMKDCGYRGAIDTSDPEVVENLRCYLKRMRDGGEALELQYVQAVKQELSALDAAGRKIHQRRIKSVPRRRLKPKVDHAFTKRKGRELSKLIVNWGSLLKLLAIGLRQRKGSTVNLYSFLMRRCRRHKRRI